MHSVSKQLFPGVQLVHDLRNLLAVGEKSSEFLLPSCIVGSGLEFLPGKTKPDVNCLSGGVSLLEVKPWQTTCWPSDTVSISTIDVEISVSS